MQNQKCGIVTNQPTLALIFYDIIGHIYKLFKARQNKKKERTKRSVKLLQP